MTRASVERVLKWIARIGGGFILLIAFAAWWALPLGPMFDDGPFHGRPTTPVNSARPDQSTPIFNGYTLEVYDSPAQKPSPTVPLRRSDGTVQWAIVADGHKPGDVQSVRFSAAHRGFCRSGTVDASVHWTYGHERSRWFITGRGNLRDYYFSW